MLLADVPPGPEARPEEITAGELKMALTGTVPRNRVSIFYQAGLLLVAVFIIEDDRPTSDAGQFIRVNAIRFDRLLA